MNDPTHHPRYQGRHVARSPWARWGVVAAIPFVLAIAAGGTVLRLQDDPAPGTFVPVGPTPTRAASGSPSAPPPTEGPDRFTMAFSGDILIHESLWDVAAAHAGPGERYDFRSLFTSIRPLLSGVDLAICHLETPLSPDDADISSYPVFETPHELASAIAWAGHEGCSTASNHSLDGGTAGVRATLRWLDDAGLEHAGTARTYRESRRITTYEVAGATVAHLAYTWGFNGFTPDHAWRANRIAVPRVLNDAARARRAGADLVVVSLHFGTEYTHDPNAFQRSVAEQLTRSRAIDLVVGHHAHVVQPLHREHGTWVAFGLGNLVSGMTSSLGTEAVADGVVLLVEAVRHGDRWSVGDVSFEPTRVEEGSWRILPVADTLARPWPSDALRAELRASWDRTVHAMRLFGDDVDPQTRPPREG
ncbi:MAG TPA: CapA family protein [Actinomycetota bacterium]|jgi:poly-gamma-glutamate synthesis protein (capsule biosynthesis protein)